MPSARCCPACLLKLPASGLSAGGDSPANQEGAVPSHRTAGRPAADVQSCSWHHVTCCFQKPKNRSVSSGRRSLDSAVLLVPCHPPPQMVHSGTGSLGCADEGHSTALGGDGPLLMATARATARGPEPASAQSSRPVPLVPTGGKGGCRGWGPERVPHEDEAGGSAPPLRPQNMALWSVGLEFGSTVRV